MSLITSNIRRFIHLLIAIILFASNVSPVLATTQNDVDDTPASAETATLKNDSSTPSQLPPTEEPAPPPVSSAKPDEPQSLAAPMSTTQNTHNSMPATPAPQQAVPGPVTVSQGENILVSAFRFTPNKGFDFIELRNTSDSFVSAEGMSVHLLYSTASTDYDCEIQLSHYFRPHSYVTYVQPTLADSYDGAYVMSGCPAQGEQLFDKEIQVVRGGQVIESVRLTQTDAELQPSRMWERAGWTASYRTGVHAKDFKISNRPAYTSAHYSPPDSASSLQFIEVLPSPAPCSSGDMALTCRPYVKLKNIGSSAVNLADFRLRSGDINARPSIYNTSSISGQIQPGEFITITADATGRPLAINDEEGSVWLEDAHGVKTYPSGSMPYRGANLTAQTNRSWAYDATDGSWKWAVPSPYAESNNYTIPGKGASESPGSTLKPCREDQYRSEETNRCRNIASTSGLSPCKEGQYRSEETNRCRSIATTAASVLKPCADDQYRNPTTNRCRKIASTDDLADCGEGRERNPATNRCRNVVSSDVPAAAFAVEPIKDSATAFVGWWALGGVAALAIGYAGWEWRREITHVLHQAGMLFRIKR